MDGGVLDRARAWLAADPDPETGAELSALIAANDRAALDDRFGGRLLFGTAGLRGALGAGSNRMNRVLVRVAASAVYTHLSTLATGRAPLVVVGFDARKNSSVFARDTAAVVASLGGQAVVLPEPLPTPVLAFAVRHLNAIAGVMVTASHNPPGDNGYKVYLADGAQLVPPHDVRIEDLMEHTPLLPAELPPPAHGGRAMVYKGDIVGEYLDHVLDGIAPSRVLAELNVAYTPLHGVGRHVFERAVVRAGAAVSVVPSQGQPDPAFPTVAFPNPEEPGALDALLLLASESDADVAIANDPDADRLAVALPAGAGRWRVLSGNEVGWLLGDFLMRTTSGADRLVVTTVVSSSLLGKMAAANGVHSVETLTGFKWIARAALDNPHRRFVFGYEEALGYACNDYVRDKDGITAAVAFLQMMADLRRQGSNPIERLEALAQAYGRHVAAQQTVRFDGAGAIGRMAAAMRAVRARPPAEIGGRRIVRATDYLMGGELPPSDILRFDLDGGARVIMRPSGTEPKLKIYVELVVPAAQADAEAAADGLAHAAAALFS